MAIATGVVVVGGNVGWGCVDTCDEFSRIPSTVIIQLSIIAFFTPILGRSIAANHITAVIKIL